MSINTILFDLDGTLIDTAPDLAYALNTLLIENNLKEKPYEQIKPLVAFGGKALIKFGFDCNEEHPDFIDRHQRKNFFGKAWFGSLDCQGKQQ